MRVPDIFKISAIEHGWFGIKIGENYIECSNYLGYDIPKMLLKIFSNLFEKKSHKEWLCWQNEPGAYIMQLTAWGGVLTIKVYSSKAEAYKIGTSEDSLKPNCNECLFEAGFDFTAAARSLLKEFALYENGNERLLYEKHWMEFPQKEYEALKKHLKHCS